MWTFNQLVEVDSLMCRPIEKDGVIGRERERERERVREIGGEREGER